MTMCPNQLFFKLFFGPFLKSLLNFLQYYFCFMLWFFGPEACGILAPQPGIEHALLRLEGEILPTGPPGKSQLFIFFSIEVFTMLCSFQLYCRVNQLCRSVYILFQSLFHYRLLQDVEYSCLSSTVGPCCLSILYKVVCCC